MARKPKKRRGSYGDGGIYLRGAIWWLKLPVGGSKPLRESTKTEDREEALEILAQRRRERTRGELVAIDGSGAAMTVGDVLDEYLQRREGKLGAGTLETYRGQAKQLMKAFKLLPVAKLTTDMMSDYRRDRRKEVIECGANAKEGNRHCTKKVEDSTINRELALLRAAMRDMHRRYPKRMGVLPHFPIEKETNVRKGHLTEEQFVKLLYPQLPMHLRAFAACAFAVGGRMSEWLRVKWADVDFDAKEIIFHKTKNHDTRIVPIIPGVMLDSLIEQKKRAEVCWPAIEEVFAYDGHPMKGIGRAFRKACIRAGFPDLLVHDARRSANRLMRNKGVPQNIRMAIMGHKTTSMDNRYGVVDLQDITDAREKMGGENPAEPKLKRIG